MESHLAQEAQEQRQIAMEPQFYKKDDSASSGHSKSTTKSTNGAKGEEPRNRGELKWIASYHDGR